MSIIDDHNAEFQHAIDHLKRELASIRTGRANTALVEGLPVEAYGTKQELKNLASIAVSDPRTLRIEPWDVSDRGSHRQGQSKNPTSASIQPSMEKLFD